MKIKIFLKSIINTLKLSRKSDKAEFLLYLRLVGLGIGVVGTIGFIIQFAAAYIKMMGT